MTIPKSTLKIKAKNQGREKMVALPKKHVGAIFLFFCFFVFLFNIKSSVADKKNNISVSSNLPHLNQLLIQKNLPFDLSTIPLPDDHPQKKVAIKISVRGHQEKIETFITYTLKLGWLRKINYQIVIIDCPVVTKTEIKFGNISEVRTYFSNNTGISSQGASTKIKKQSNWKNPDSLPQAMMADLEKIYDLAVKALLNQDNDSIHQIIHQLALDEFFLKHRLINSEDIKVVLTR